MAKYGNMKSMISNELERGDLIIIAYSNGLEIAFYLGRGQGGSVQYYTISSLEIWLDNYNNPNIETKRKTPYKGYLINAEWRIAKYHHHCIENPEYIEQYEKAIAALTLLNII